MPRFIITNIESRQIVWIGSAKDEVDAKNEFAKEYGYKSYAEGLEWQRFESLAAKIEVTKAPVISDGSVWTMNGKDHVVTRTDSGDVFVARSDGSDGRMVMWEKFLMHAEKVV